MSKENVQKFLEEAVSTPELAKSWRDWNSHVLRSLLRCTRSRI